MTTKFIQDSQSGSMMVSSDLHFQSCPSAYLALNSLSLILAIHLNLVVRKIQLDYLLADPPGKLLFLKDSFLASLRPINALQIRSLSILL